MVFSQNTNRNAMNQLQISAYIHIEFDAMQIVQREFQQRSNNTQVKLQC